MKTSGEYHDLYVQSDTLLAVVFQNFMNICHETYELDPVHFISAPGFAWEAALKNTKVEFELTTDIDMLLMVENVIRGGICHSSHQYAKTNDRCIKDYGKNKEFSFLKYWDVNNLYRLVVSQRFPLSGFKWIENSSQVN